MKKGLLLLAVFFLASSCAVTKTRQECEKECRRQGFAFSGTISRTEKQDEAGNVELQEVCRCNFEKAI